MQILIKLENLKLQLWKMSRSKSLIVEAESYWNHMQSDYPQANVNTSS